MSARDIGVWCLQLALMQLRGAAGCAGDGEPAWQVLRMEEPSAVHARWMLERASRRLEEFAPAPRPGAADAAPARARCKQEVD